MNAVYHLSGSAQAVLFLLSISAVYVQLRFVRQRRRQIAAAGKVEAATDNLSVFAITGAFLAFFSFLLLSTATEPFAHYIFWSRLPACVLAVLLLWEYRRDYPSSALAILGPVTMAIFVAALIWTATLPEINRQFISSIQLFVLGAGVFLVGGQLHQLRLLLVNRRVGALSLRARTLNLLKDLSTVFFGFALGIHQSWALIAVAGANAALTAMVIIVGMRLGRQNV